MRRHSSDDWLREELRRLDRSGDTGKPTDSQMEDLIRVTKDDIAKAFGKKQKVAVSLSG